MDRKIDPRIILDKLDNFCQLIFLHPITPSLFLDGKTILLRAMIF